MPKHVAVRTNILVLRVIESLCFIVILAPTGMNHIKINSRPKQRIFSSKVARSVNPCSANLIMYGINKDKGTRRREVSK